MKKIFMMCLILFVGSSTLVLAYESIVKGSYSNVDLIINEVPVYKNNLYNPLINIDGNTYMSVRDFGRYSNLDVSWNENNNKIIMQANNNISINVDTALTIGRAIIQDVYKERVTDNTQYMIFEAMANRVEAKPYFIIYVCFEPKDEIGDDFSKMQAMADVCINFHDYLNDIKIEEMNCEK